MSKKMNSSNDNIPCVPSPPPPFGLKFDLGRRDKMEDFYLIIPNFLELTINTVDNEEIVPETVQRLKYNQRTESFVDVYGLFGSGRGGGGGTEEIGHTTFEKTKSLTLSDPFLTVAPVVIDTIHLFSVFDGHGGVNAAKYCSEQLHINLKQSFLKISKNQSLNKNFHHSFKQKSSMFCASYTQNVESDVCAEIKDINIIDLLKQKKEKSIPDVFSQSPRNILDNNNMEDLLNSGRKLDEFLSRKLSSEKKHTNGLNSINIKDAIHKAYLETHKKFLKEYLKDESGTTAVIALISGKLLCFSSCGDSRAVLCRRRKPFQVTRDHSTNALDEKERIKALGGHVITTKGDGERVMGVLSMTRAIGDYGLNPYIIPDPEITILNRSKQDEFVILATDGLWGYVSNEVAISIVLKCFDRAEVKGLPKEVGSRLASAVLMRHVYEKGAPDNVTIVVLDLRQIDLME